MKHLSYPRGIIRFGLILALALGLGTQPSYSNNFPSIQGQIGVADAAPATPGAVSGPAGVCRSSQNQIFSVAPVANATAYLWTLPVGATGSSTSNTISVSFSSSYSGGTICAQAINANGTSGASCKSIPLFTQAPSSPGVITEACVGGFRTFSIATVANATSYAWSAPSGTQIVEGQGTPQIKLTANSTFNTGTLSVRAVNCISQSTSRSLTIKGKLNTPVSITGAVTGACAGSTQAYSTALIPGATTYNWVVPANAVITSGIGTNAITVLLPVNFTTGNLSVTAANGCVSSAPKTVALSAAPTYPSTIQGQINNLCGGGVFTYTATPVIGATGYSWTTPVGTTIAAQTNNSITLNIPSSFVSGDLRVSATNTCGAGPSFLKIMTLRPELTTAPIGPTKVCRNSPIATYSVTVPTGSTIDWRTGVPIISQTPSSITVDLSSIGTTTVIYAYAVNACGSSAGRNTDISVRTCTNARFGESETENTLSLYPNPSQGKISLRVLNPLESANILIYNVQGKLVSQQKNVYISEGTSFDFSFLPAGLYKINIITNQFSQSMNWVKE